MRIGLIRMRHTPYGGAEVFLTRFIAELGKRGHTVEVFSSNWESGDGVTVHHVSTFGPKFLRYLLFASRAEKAVEHAGPDVVISLERTYCQDIYRAGDGCHREWLNRRARVVSPLKRLLIGLNPFHMAILYLEKRLFTSPRLKLVVANSEMVKRDILRHYSLPEEKICVIYNGISLPEEGERAGARSKARAELDIPEDNELLLFVGSGFERKGLEYLIRALGELVRRRPGRTALKLLVVGRGKPGKYLAVAKEAGVEDRVIFAGPVKGATRLYPAGDVFVLPTLYEPFSNACLEAMAAGLPVVTTEANGAAEIISEGVNGAVVADPTDHVSLADSIEPFLDPEKGKAAGRAARETARGYTMEKNVTEFLRLLG